MNAVVYTRFGLPEVFEYQEVRRPVPKDDEVLVKVEAASVNSWDWDLMTGTPRIYRPLFGWIRPRYSVIGSDIAGIVEDVGKNVGRFRPGDEVFGDLSGSGFGAFAEYACAREDVLALKPEQLSFEEAAALPQAGTLALQGLRLGELTEGQKILINGAGGGVGTFAIQIAKTEGADVTAVDCTAKMEKLKTLAADHAIDHTFDDFTKMGCTYDLVLDMVASKSPGEYKKVLAPKGICVVVGGNPAQLISYALLGNWILGSRKIRILVHKPNPKDLDCLSALCQSGKIKPVVDRIFPLKATAEALRHFGEGNFFGKVIIKM